MRHVERYEVIWWRGHKFDRKTVAALEWAEKKSGVQVQVSQGSYNPGGVSASGSTHALGGAVDVRCAHLSLRSKVRLLRWLKRAGFAAWRRRAVPGLWGEHIHAIQIRNAKASVAAQGQVRAFLARRDGLAGNRLDLSFRPRPQVYWSWGRGRPVPM